MKRYRFPLGQVLRVRRIEEDRAAGELAAARLAERAEEERKAARLAACQAVASPPPPAGAGFPGGVGGFLAWRDRCDRAGSAAIAAAHAHREAIAQSERSRAGWAAAAMRVSALEHLDDRRRAEHRDAAERAETVAADDLVTSRWSRS